MDTYLKEFVDKYNGKPIVFIVTGAGVSLSALTLIPGSSKVVEGIVVPYGETMFRHTVHPWVYDKKYVGYSHSTDLPRVSPDVTRAYMIHALDKYGNDTPVVVVNGALITNRYRKGEHHAYFVVNRRLYHVILPKETEEEWNELNKNGDIDVVRAEQDQSISKLVLAVLNGDIPPFSDTFMKVE